MRLCIQVFQCINLFQHFGFIANYEFPLIPPIQMCMLLFEGYSYYNMLAIFSFSRDITLALTPSFMGLSLLFASLTTFSFPANFQDVI